MIIPWQDSLADLSSCLANFLLVWCVDLLPLTYIAFCSNVFRSLSQVSSSSLSDIGTMGGKRKGRRSSFLSAKKLYEVEMMSRRVRQYLDSHTQESNEDTLHELSMQCEPANSSSELARNFKEHNDPDFLISRMVKIKNNWLLLVVHYISILLYSACLLCMYFCIHQLSLLNQVMHEYFSFMFSNVLEYRNVT